MTSPRRRFSVALPDWGSDHLSTEAVAAYVDDELAPGPRSRADQHLATCQECAAQVSEHGRARIALRTAETPCVPSSLLSALRSIPERAELPPPPAGLAVAPDGQLVDVLRPECVPGRNQHPLSRDHREGGAHRRVLLGAAAVSGLALGALAFGVSAAAPGPDPAAPERGVFNGPVLGGANAPTEAGLRLSAPNNPANNSAGNPVGAPASDLVLDPVVLDDHGVRSWLLGH